MRQYIDVLISVSLGAIMLYLMLILASGASVFLRNHEDWEVLDTMIFIYMFLIMIVLTTVFVMSL